MNGPLEASFERAPTGATSFKTINGDVEVTFPADLAADLEFQTMHGEIYTDFDVEPLARDPVGERTPRRRDVRNSRAAPVGRPRRGGRTNPFVRDVERRHLRSGDRPMRTTSMLTSALALMLASGGAAAQSEQRIAVPLSDPARPATLNVSLIMGGISVSAYEGNEIIIVVRDGRDEDDDDDDDE